MSGTLTCRPVFVLAEAAQSLIFVWTCSVQTEGCRQALLRQMMLLHFEETGVSSMQKRQLHGSGMVFSVLPPLTHGNQLQAPGVAVPNQIQSEAGFGFGFLPGFKVYFIIETQRGDSGY